MLMRTSLVALLMLSTSAIAQDYKEAPSLADQVAAGTLPPLAERLPAKPLVFKTGEEIPAEDLTVTSGTYGGTLRLAFSGTTSPEYSFGSNEQLLQQVGLGSTADAPLPAIVESYEINDDATEFTFHLRAGMKWSDGEPVTTEDVRFWWEDIQKNTALTASVPRTWTSNGQPMDLTVVDDTTFTVKFGAPYISFLYELSNRWRVDIQSLIVPSHYLKQFHASYADKDELAKKIADAGLGPDEWAKLFFSAGWGPNGPTELTTAPLNVPTLRPWVITDHPSLTTWVAKRNPYYWKVDEAGQQLPYIDEIRFEQVSEPQLIILKAMAGEIDLVREAVSTMDIPLLKENEAKGGYVAKLLKLHNSVMVAFNFSYEADPELADLFNNTDFRRALNLAISRDEIVESVYLGLATSSYTVDNTFDPDAANKILDGLGLDKRDAEGYRLLPSGKRLTIVMNYAELATDFTPTMDILRENWREIGVEFDTKVVTVPLWREEREANKGTGYILFADIPVARGNPAMWQTLVGGQAFRWGPQYGLWYNSNGAQGRAPSGDVAEVFQYAKEMREADSVDALNTAFQKTLDILHDRAPWFIAAEDVTLPLVVNAKLGNVADTGYQIVATFDLEGYYFKQ